MVRRVSGRSDQRGLQLVLDDRFREKLFELGFVQHPICVCAFELALFIGVIEGSFTVFIFCFGVGPSRQEKLDFISTAPECWIVQRRRPGKLIQDCSSVAVKCGLLVIVLCSMGRRAAKMMVLRVLLRATYRI